MLAGLILTALLAPTTGVWFTEQTVPTFHIGEPDTIWTGSWALRLGLIGPLVYGAPFALWVVFLSEALFGATPGHRILRIAPADGAGLPLTPLGRWRRFAWKALPLTLIVAGLVLTSWPLAAAGVAAAPLLGTGWLVVWFDTAGRLWHDRLSRSIVVRTHQGDGDP